MQKYKDYLEKSQKFTFVFGTTDKEGNLLGLDGNIKLYLNKEEVFIGNCKNKSLQDYMGEKLEVSVVKLNEKNKSVYVGCEELKRHFVKTELEKVITQKKKVKCKGIISTVYPSNAYVNLEGVGISGYISAENWRKNTYTRDLTEVCKVGEIYEFEVFAFETQPKSKNKKLKFYMLSRENLTTDPWDNFPEDFYQVDGSCDVECVQIISQKNYWWGRIAGLEDIEVQGVIHKKNPMAIGNVYRCKILTVDSQKREFRVLPYKTISANQELTTEGNLNKLVNDCLHVGAIDKGLNVLEENKTKISKEAYFRYKHRLLAKKYKDTKDDNVRKEHIECIEAVLSYSNKTNSTLALLLEKGNMHVQGGEIVEAKETFQKWINLYNEYKSANPEAAAALSGEYDYIMNAINSEEISTESILEVVEIEVESKEDTIDEFVLELLDSVSCAVLGEKYAVFDELNEESQNDKEDLKELLDELNDSNEKEVAWAIAKAYVNAADYISEKRYIEKRDKSLKNALLINASSFLFENERGYSLWRRLASQYYCSLALAKSITDGEIAGALGTFVLSQEEFVSACNNKLSISTVLKKCSRSENLSISLKGLILLCSKNKTIMGRIEESIVELKEDSDTYDKLKKSIALYADNCEGELKELLEKAVQRYENFNLEFTKLSKTEGKAVAFATVNRDFINQEQYKCWLMEDVIDRDELRTVFRNIQDYDSVRGFTQKSEILRNVMEKVKKNIESIRKYPSLQAYGLYLPRLDDYYAKLLYTYQTLCKTTKPLIKIEPGDLEKVDDNLVYTVIVQSEDHGVQDAKNVTLLVNDSQDVKCKKTHKVIDSLPNDGRKQIVSIPIQINDDKKDVVTLQFKVRYEYISDVKIEEFTRSFRRGSGRRRIVQSQEIRNTASFPNGDGEWVSFDIPLNLENKKHVLSDDRIKKFSDDGRVDLEDEGLKKILKNRDIQIKKAVDALTVSNEGAPRTLSIKGRWVILYGQWRVGKSVILNCIEDKLTNKEDYPNAIILKLQCEGSDKEDFESHFATEIYNSLRGAMRRSKYKDIFEDIREYWGISKANPDVSWDTLGHFMSDFITDVREVDRDAAVVLLIDEFTEIYQAIIKRHAGERFPARWTEFIDKTNVLCVTAGGEHTVSLMDTYTPNTLQKAEEKIYVEYLSRQNVDEYLHYVMGESEEDKVPQNASYFSAASDKAIDRVFELTGGNAYLLKNFCKWLMEYMNEKQSLYLTVGVVENTLDYIMKKEGMDVDSLETTYFNSLYNPFNETTSGDEKDETVVRIEDDIVRSDNLIILHKIVELADKSTHLCSYEELSDVLSTMESFKRRYNTLVSRKIIREDSNKNISIVIDLYYEIVSRIWREKNNGSR